MIHALKIEQQFFEAVIDKEKTFEVRKNDRNFKVGDYLALNEVNDTSKGYTGRALLLKVTYVLKDERFCKEGFAILGFNLCSVSTGRETAFLLREGKNENTQNN